MIESPYITAAEAIAYLRLGSESALYRLVREHRMPACRRGRLYLFDTRELDAWVHGHTSAIEYARAKRSVHVGNGPPQLNRRHVNKVAVHAHD